MKTLLFFDDWLLHRRDGLERVWHPPALVKEIFTESYPGFLGYGGYMTAFYDERVGRYVLYLAVYPPKADPETFVVRLESDDPAAWTNPRHDRAVTPAWKGFAQVLVDARGERFWPYAVMSLAGTPLADRGYVTTSYYYQKPPPIRASGCRCSTATRSSRFPAIPWRRRFPSAATTSSPRRSGGSARTSPRWWASRCVSDRHARPDACRGAARGSCLTGGAGRSASRSRARVSASRAGEGTPRATARGG
jgi:hypothetical protein